MKLTILGQVRTNNFNDSLLMQKITGLWEEASQHLTSDRVAYGVYHDYESDYRGDYTLSIAVEAGNSGPALELPDHTHYKIFRVDPADEYGVVNAWKQIWELEQTGELKRAYTFDYEKYDTNGNIEVYIAIV